jgi:hypothetical protein
MSRTDDPREPTQNRQQRDCAHRWHRDVTPEGATELTLECITCALRETLPMPADLPAQPDTEDVYLIAARAYQAKDVEIIGLQPLAVHFADAVRRLADNPRHRAAVDAGREHEFRRALPELARLTALELDTYSDRVDTLVADLAAARAEADSLRTEVERLKAELADASYEPFVVPEFVTDQRVYRVTSMEEVTE